MLSLLVNLVSSTDIKKKTLKLLHKSFCSLLDIWPFAGLFGTFLDIWSNYLGKITGSNQYLLD